MLEDDDEAFNDTLCQREGLLEERSAPAYSRFSPLKVLNAWLVCNYGFYQLTLEDQKDWPPMPVGAAILQYLPDRCSFFHAALIRLTLSGIESFLTSRV